MTMKARTMTIRFASARSSSKSAIGPWRCRSVALCAANDNTVPDSNRTMLVAALRHFARHGIAAAEHAGASAVAARHGGDRDACLYWLAVCRQLDRRMAERLIRRHPDLAQ